ncbi:peptidoglycan-binding lysin domain-containing protein [Tanacetum coccineum]
MARNTSMFVTIATTLSLFLILTALVQSRVTLVGGFLKAKSVVCNEVYGVEVGDDCTAISQAFQMSLGSFLGINPNINCESIFVGQWVCVDGSSAN